MIHLTDIGFISKAFGFQGEVVFVPEGYPLPARIRFLFFMLEGKPVPFLLESSREKNDHYILKFEDINDEAAARKLAGQRVHAESSQLTATATGFTWNTLTGYEVLDKTAGSLGPLLAVEEYPGHLVGRCEMNGKEVLFPLLEDFLADVDHEKKILHLELPDGLLDIYLDDH